MRIPRSEAASVLLALSATATVEACPYCQSALGERVYAGIFNDDFWSNALLTLLPFPILIGIVVLLHFGLPMPGLRSRSQTQLADPKSSTATQTGV